MKFDLKSAIAAGAHSTHSCSLNHSNKPAFIFFGEFKAWVRLFLSPSVSFSLLPSHMLNAFPLSHTYLVLLFPRFFLLGAGIRCTTSYPKPYETSNMILRSTFLRCQRNDSPTFPGAKSHSRRHRCKRVDDDDGVIC